MTDAEKQTDYYKSVTDTVSSLFELTTRMDERVATIISKQAEVDLKIESLLSNHNNLTQRLAIFEAEKEITRELKVELKEAVEKFKSSVENINNVIGEIKIKLSAVERDSSKQESRWQNIFSFAAQIAWVILAAYLLYKLGIQAPAVP